jgi:uncharacterized protein (TIGR02444 family)
MAYGAVSLAVQQDRSSFWTFSLAVYGNVAVQRECLDLQDRHGLNVNLLLFCAFIGAVHGAVLLEADVQLAFNVVHDWHAQVVNSLHTARRALKSLSNDASAVDFHLFYNGVKERELEAERLEQTMLEAWSVSHLHAWSRTLPSAAIEKNIATLFEFCAERLERHKLPSNLIAEALHYATKLRQVEAVLRR